MTKLSPNHLVVHLLSLADELATHGGSAALRQVAMRRAVSSAYYALFHALCYICSDGLVRWNRAALVNEIYRCLDHGTAKRRLAEPAARLIHPVIPQVSVAFRDLQGNRHDADYARPMDLFDRTKTLALIEQAREAVSLIQQLDPEARTRLAILLVVNKRPG